tara:strand:+ start:4213 stop:6408 length:2196 start_codon:yes stop_codon:yes gene_type:complete
LLDRILRLINVYETEFMDLMFSVCISFVVKFLTVIGWSFLIIYFVELYSFEFLINLFLTHGVAMILGYFLFKNIFSKYKLNVVFSILVTIFSLISLVLPFIRSNQILFITCVFLAFSLILNQIKIAKNLFVEDLFSPIQSTRIFPVVEASETLAVILAGLFISLFAYNFTFESIFFICAFMSAFLLPIIVMHENSTLKQDFNHLFEFNESSKDSDSEAKLSVIKYVVFFQVLFFVFLEFQYLYLLDLNYHSSFAIELGFYHVVFGGIAIFFQLFLTSHILKFLGVVKSMLVSPITLAFLSFLGLFHFNFLSTLILKTNQELSNILHYNAYHSSYYAFDHNSRVRFMELNEAYYRPLALIVGSAFIFLTINLFQSYSYLSFFMIIALLFSIFFALRFKSAYDDYPINEIKSANSDFKIINALFILEQNFKSHYIPFLTEFMMKNDLSHSVYSKILYILNKHLNINYIDAYLDLFKNKKYQLKTCKIIRNILKNYRSQIDDLSITRSTILNTYSELFESTIDMNLKAEILCFRILADVDIENSLLELSNLNLDSSASLIYETLSSFDDPMFVKYYKDGWDNLSPLSKYYALSAVNKFQPELIDKYVFKLFSSNNPLDHSYLLLFLINNKIDYKFELKLESPVNDFLFNLYKKGIYYACKRVSFNDLKNSRSIWTMLDSKYYLNTILSFFHDRIYESEFLNSQCKDSIVELRDIYSIIGRHNEVLFLNTVLENI